MTNITVEKKNCSFPIIFACMNKKHMLNIQGEYSKNARRQTMNEI